MLYSVRNNAGSQLNSIQKWLNGQSGDSGIINSLLDHLCSFNVRSDLDLNKVNQLDSTLMVYHNMITRGFPTRTSLFIESSFARKIDLIRIEENHGSWESSFTPPEGFFNQALSALHVIEPRATKMTAYGNYLKSWESHGSSYEEKYLFAFLPELDGNSDYLIQLFEPQRSLDSMLSSQIEILETDVQENFKDQHVDFALEFPYQNENGRKGICVEIDGPQHNERSQSHLDTKRDDALFSSNWVKTLRLRTSDFGENNQTIHEQQLKKHLQHPFIDHISENYRNPLYSTSSGLLAMDLILAPIAISRIQNSLLKSILTGGLSLKSKEWRIAFIERDVPCSELAILDFKRFFSAFQSMGSEMAIPRIEYTIYGTKEFEKSSLRSVSTKSIERLKEDQISYDLVIDISVLERVGLSKRPIELGFDHFLEIRSSFYAEDNHQFMTGKTIQWNELIGENDRLNDQAVDGLRFFVREIFYKKDFRPGQIKILNRALQNKTVIGLLPTGGGKSLTYQVAGMLQPGLVIVIDPIKSLMKDQVDSLARMGITNTVYINSSLKTLEDRQQAMSRLQNAKSLFCFVSPERMMITSFRDVLDKMRKNGHYFSYGVIDEVHCVSEWGHDFRTPYLSLGRNLINHCNAYDGKIALFGLTATASYDVLSDVQRELSGDGEDEISDEAIVRHETTNRNEIQFLVENVSIDPNRIEEIEQKAGEGWFEFEVKKELGQLKQARILDVLKRAPDQLRKYQDNKEEVISDELIELTYEIEVPPTTHEIHERIKLDKSVDPNDFWSKDGLHAGLVFTPHKSWYYGVTDQYNPNAQAHHGVADHISRQNNGQFLIGTYMGANSDEEGVNERIESANFKNQEDYIANKQNLMVATKAFGMGIDKPNIRCTVHTTYPGSIESFVQEAGRAGRDGKIALSAIVFNDQQIKDKDNPEHKIENDFEQQTFFYNNSFKGQQKEKAVLFELLTEIKFPGGNITEIIAKQFNEFREEDTVYKLNFSANHNNRLFINGENGARYGGLQITTGNLSPTNHTTTFEHSNKLLTALWHLLLEMNLPTGQDERIAWISRKIPAERSPGIEKVLDNLDFGDEYDLVIPFRNDRDTVMKRVAGLLHPIFTTITPEICLAQFTSLSNEFLTNIGSHFNINDIQQHLLNYFGSTDDLNHFKENLQLALDSSRDKADTEKAIYRLVTLGVLDDYTIDYNSETDKVFGRKKTDEELHQHLRNYISKYYSQRRTEAIINGLADRKGNTEIQRILNFTIDFVYKEVAKKRYESIKAMKQCCLVGLNQGNLEMKSFIHLYFNSKYARKDYSIEVEQDAVQALRVLPSKRDEDDPNTYNASLLDWTEEGRLEEFDWVLDFMTIVEIDSLNSQRDNLKHLRGACIRLLTNKDNLVFRFLRAYSVLLLQEIELSKSHKKSIYEDLIAGTSLLIDHCDGDQVLFNNRLSKYFDKTKTHLNEPDTLKWLDEQIEQLQFLSHAKWMQKFTETYTVGLNLQES